MSHSRQPLVKGERLVRYEVNTVMNRQATTLQASSPSILILGACKHAFVHDRKHMDRIVSKQPILKHCFKTGCYMTTNFETKNNHFKTKPTIISPCA